jgi:hypothetical protein
MWTSWKECAMGWGSFNTGDLNPGTGGNRDTYNPEVGSRTGTAEYKTELDREAAEKKKGLLARVLGAVRRVIWGV